MAKHLHILLDESARAALRRGISTAAEDLGVTPAPRGTGS